MGITIVEKSSLLPQCKKARRALVLAGGAVTGGSFMAGGVKALNDYFTNFKVRDFDIFVGISAGSLLAAPLMGGISPESILKSLDGTSKHFSRLGAWHYYRPNTAELLLRPLKFAVKAAGFIPSRLFRVAEKFPDWWKTVLGGMWRFAMYPSLSTYEEMIGPVIAALDVGDFSSLLGLLPSGVFDNSPIEHYIRHNIERNGLVNDFDKSFKLTGKRLYICAMKLDGAKRVVFGPGEDESLSISEAIWASTAMPGFYKPALINGAHYVDGGVQETANIDIAVNKGAGLIICYNPFRPYEPKDFVEKFRLSQKGAHSLASSGLVTVLNQIFRAFFHERLGHALEQFKKDPKFKGDIVLIEPRSDDAAFFALNPLLLKNRLEAARLGYESVRNSIDEKFEEVSKIMAAYGIDISRKSVEDKFEKLKKPDTSEDEIRFLLEGVKRGPKRGKVKTRNSKLEGKSKFKDQK